MAKDHDKSLGDQPSIVGGGGGKDQGPQSLGDQATFAGGALGSGTQSLGDQSTIGGGGTDRDMSFDDGMEVVDLSARYTTEGVLGKGGMGEVLLATDTRLDRKVAIKRILGDAASSRTAVNRFLTEAQSIAALSSHPNIVDIYDYGRAADGPFLIMEYVDGGSLLDRCRAGAIPLDEAIELTCQLCSALDKAHAADIIHRDIKPANVLMSEDGTPVLTDFGLAKDEAADTGQTMAGAVLGTLDFMPPEQRQDAALADARSDLWSLAATLYQMVTGKSPKIIRFNNVPQSLQDVLGKALEEEKDDRYQTAREFSDALRASLQAGDSGILEQGDCPACGTKNPTNRKFCRNPDCGGSLEAPCLSCTAAMPMWEEVCGDCGTKQSDLLQERRTKMASMQSEAESLLRDYDFAEATQLATQLQEESDVRLQHLQGWADQFLKTIEREKQSQQDQIAALLAEAGKHEQAYDYKAGIHALQQVPERLCSMSISGVDETLAQVLERLKEKQQEGQRLNKLIRQRIADKEFDGLAEHVETLLSLKPEREDLLRLQVQLASRQQKLELVRDDALQAAQQLLEQKNYEGCLEQLGRINPTLLTSEIKQLRNDAQERLDRLQHLRSAINTAAQSQQWRGLLPQVEEYLTLQSDDEKMSQLQTRLAVLEKKNTAQIAKVMDKANDLRAACRFAEACKLLEQIPSHRLTDEADELLQDCADLSDERGQALEALDLAISQQEFKVGLKACKTYRELLESELLEDEKFEARYQECKHGLQEQQEAIAARQRQRTIKLGMATAGVLALGLLSGVGLWMRASMHASAIAEALKQSDYEAVLALDGENVKALIGRARKRLGSDTPDIHGAFADLSFAEQLDSGVAELTQTKAATYAKRATVRAAAGEISAAQQDYAQARTLGATAAELKQVSAEIASRYLKQAEVGVAGGAIADIRSACDAAERYAAPIADLNRLRAQAFRAEGQQQQKLGNLAGALSSFEEAVNLDSSVSLNSERAAVHVQLGNQAIAQQDYKKAATELFAAVTLDSSTEGTVELAAVVAESAVAAFEQAPTITNQTAALAAISGIRSLDSGNIALPNLHKRVTALGLKRSESVADNAPDSAKASADDASVAKPDSEAASPLGPEFEKLPAIRQIDTLNRLAGQEPTAESALELYHYFTSRHTIPDDLKTRFNERFDTWKERAEKKLVRLGTNWVAVEKRDAVADEAREMIHEAFRLLKVGDKQGSEKQFLAASRHDPNAILSDYIIGLFNSGKMLKETVSHPEAAIRHFRKVLRRSPRHVGAMNNLAVAYMKNGEANQAAALWKQTREIEPTNNAVQQNLRRTLFEYGRGAIEIKLATLTKIKGLVPVGSSDKPLNEAGLVWAISPAIVPDNERVQDETESTVAQSSGESLVSLVTRMGFKAEAEYYSDRSCAHCNGWGKLACSEPKCRGGKILTIIKYQTKDYLPFPAKGGPKFVINNRKKSVTTTCSTCSGKNVIDCKFCKDDGIAKY
jgi:serine/threonine protein kinase/tetratricopeptide (TPR) repeat protein